MIKLKFFLIIFLIPLEIFAQIGGNHTYKFLELTNSARAASLGGVIISVSDQDLSLPFHNPALLSDTMHNQLVLNYVNYFSDINYGYLAYARKLPKIGIFSLGLHYINYGDFVETSDIGEILGEFKAAEYAFNLIWSLKLDTNFSVGVNLKPIVSNLEQYSSFGLAFDAGIVYQSKEGLLTTALVMKNLGKQITTYTDSNREPIPFELQFGLTKDLEHAPFRLTFLYRHIEKWKMDFESPISENTLSFFEEETKKESKIGGFSENLLRHTVWGIEFIPFNSFFFNFSYNYQRRKELSLQNATNMTGFSWGFGLNLRRFSVSYGRASYHVAGASNHFSFNTRFGK